MFQSQSPSSFRVFRLPVNPVRVIERAPDEQPTVVPPVDFTLGGRKLSLSARFSNPSAEEWSTFNGPPCWKDEPSRGKSTIEKKMERTAVYIVVEPQDDSPFTVEESGFTVETTYRGRVSQHTIQRYHTEFKESGGGGRSYVTSVSLTDLMSRKMAFPQDYITVTVTASGAQPEPEVVKPDIVRVYANEMFRAGEFTDAEVVADGETEGVKVHKMVLAAQSQYWRALLHGSMNRGESERYVVHEVTPGALRGAVEWAYTGSLQPDMEVGDAIELFGASSMFMMDDLHAACESLLCSRINKDTAIDIHAVGKLHGSEKLTSIVLKFGEYHMDDLMNEDTWAAMCSREPQLLNEIVSRTLKRKQPEV